MLLVFRAERWDWVSSLRADHLGLENLLEALPWRRLVLPVLEGTDYSQRFMKRQGPVIFPSSTLLGQGSSGTIV